MEMTTNLLAEIRERNKAGENDTIIAEELGLNPGMVQRYRARMGLPSHGRVRRNPMLYMVWDAKTDELLVCGDSDECVAALGFTSQDTFHQMVCRALKGKIQKYHVEKMKRCEL